MNFIFQEGSGRKMKGRALPVVAIISLGFALSGVAFSQVVRSGGTTRYGNPADPLESQTAVVGVILHPEEVDIFQHVKTFFRLYDVYRFENVEFIREIVKEGDAVELNRAVCRLMERGVVALFATTMPFSYKMLLSFSNEFQLPLIAPSFPSTSYDSVATFGVGIQASTTRAILDIFRSREWKDIVYLYDSDHDSGRLHEIFLLGYRVMQTQLLGILKVNQSEDANFYLRKLNAARRNRHFNVILDTKVELAKDIIVRHFNDVHIERSNFHFIMTELVMGELWTAQSTGIGTVSVTGFRIKPPVLTHRYFSAMKKFMQEQMGQVDIPVSSYYMYDAFTVLHEALRKMTRIQHSYPGPLWDTQSRDCIENTPKSVLHGATLSQCLKEVELTNGLTGGIRFDTSGRRKQFSIEVLEMTPLGQKIVGSWSDSSGLRMSSTQTEFPMPSARTDEQKRYKITGILSPPFLMMNNNNSSTLKGNDRFKGYIKDLIDILARDMNFQYEFHVVEDGKYGKWDEASGRWTGLIGEVLQGKADIAAADLTITPLRHRIIDFTEPFQMVSLSLLMKNPAYISSSASSFFFFTSFSGTVWICIFASAAIISILLFIISKFTGSPDSIESATGLWGKKFTLLSSAWFVVGSTLFRGTGVYPRSISSRIIAATWWCFSLLMLALFIANIASQLYLAYTDYRKNPNLAQLRSLSMESIIAESVTRGWPMIGLIKSGTTEKFIRASSLPIFKAYADFLDLHPEVKVRNALEGAQKVSQSYGQYGFLTESLRNEYVSNQEPCDTVLIQDSIMYAAYAMVVPKGSPLRFELNSALSKIRERGELGHIHRKWWIDNSPCLREDIIIKSHFEVNLSSTSGVFYLFLVGLGVAAIVTGVQYFWRMHKKEERRKKLSFEDVTLGHSLPLPPPELLNDSPLEEDSGVIDGWAERQLVPTSFGDRST